MSVLSDERFIEHLEQVFEDAMRGVAYLGVGVKAVAEAAIAADRAQGAEPVLYQYRFKGMYGDVWRTSPAGWNGLKPVETRALYSYPPQASATVPEGMVMVPVKPTDEMLESARLATESEGLTTTTWLRNCVYRAMLAAAPSRPGDEKEGCGYTCPGRGACKAQEGT